LDGVHTKMINTLPIEKFSFDKVTIDRCNYVARIFGFKFIPIGKRNYQLFKEGVHMGGYQGTLKECYAYLMGWQAK
jgi:hypothetical protein